MDIHDLYELCVQSPGHMVSLLRAIHGGGATVLGEDFAGTGALCRAWCAAAKGNRAIAVDLDSGVLARAAAQNGVEVVVGDARSASDPARHVADVVFAGNFSIGYMHSRADLMAYMRHAAARLRPGGVVVIDTYGGESSFRGGSVERVHPVAQGAYEGVPDGCRVVYTWEQREADPLTAMVTDVLHFRLERGEGRARDVLQEWPEAFVYPWRLWSVPELRDAMREAGLARTDVYATLPDAVDGDGNAYVEPVTGEDLEESFIVLVAGRRDATACA